jgi:signal peptidase I
MTNSKMIERIIKRITNRKRAIIIRIIMTEGGIIIIKKGRKKVIKIIKINNMNKNIFLNLLMNNSRRALNKSLLLRNNKNRLW